MYGMPSLRFRLGPFPVQIELFHFIGAAVLGMNQARGSQGLLWLLLWIAVLIVSVLAHELIHAVALARLRRPATITLHGMGAVTTHPGSITPRQNVAVHLAAPVLLLVVVGLPARWWYWHGSFSSEFLLRLAFDLYQVNFWWSIFNLLPLWPLDGGQALASFTELRRGRPDWRLVHWVSITTAVVGGVWSLSASRDNAYIFIFGLILAVQNFMRLQGGRPIMLHPGYDGALVDGPAARERRPGRMGEGRMAREARQDREPRQKPVKQPKAKPAERLARGFALLAKGDTDAARAEAEAVRDAKPTLEHRALAGELIAWSFLQERNVPKARAAIAEVPDRSVLSRCLMAALEITGADEARGVHAVALALVTESDGPATRQVIDYVGRRDLGVSVAQELLALPNGQGFEAAVQLAGVLAACGRREQANRVQELLFGG
jgi:Zn-dependent protease